MSRKRKLMLGGQVMRILAPRLPMVEGDVVKVDGAQDASLQVVRVAGDRMLLKPMDFRFASSPKDRYLAVHAPRENLVAVYRIVAGTSSSMVVKGSGAIDEESIGPVQEAYDGSPA